jgi:outer membrane receptor protein involved in Fe transport
MTRIAALLAGVLLLAAANAAPTTNPTRLSLIVFEAGNTVAGVEVVLDGEVVGTTDADGAFVGGIPSGRHELVLRREGTVLKRVDLLTDSGESIQMIADVPPGGGANSASLDIESSGGGQAVAQQQEGETEADPGALTGRIVSAESGEPIANAKVYFAGLQASITTNEQGRYEAEVPAGTYQVSVVHPDYATQTLENVRVIPGKQVTANIELSPAGLQLADYVVTAPYVEGSVASVLNQQREASGVTNVIGAAQMSRTGDSDAAEALQRVTGLTIEDGKFVVIRGQPSRYTYTQWNGSPLPSPDPIKRIVPLDLFPTGVLSSVEVQKSYTPDKPGAFGGGLVQLRTRGVPESAFGEASASLGINSLSTGTDAPTYEGGDTDYLGYDDGTREIPSKVRAAGDSIENLPADERAELGKAFPNIYNVDRETLPPDMSFSISGGNRYDALGGEVGFLGSFSYGRNSRYREEIQRSYAAFRGGLVLQDDFVEERADTNVDLGGLVTLSGEWDATTLSSNTFLIRKTTKRTQVTEGIDEGSDTTNIRDTLLEWNERELLIQQFQGSHELEDFTVDWRYLLAEGSRDSPDRRTYRYALGGNGEYTFDDQQPAERRYNTVDDSIDQIGIDLTVPLVESERWQAEGQFGLSRYGQDRVSEIRRFTFDPSSGGTAPPEEVLAPENIGDTVEFNEATQTNDDYEGSARVDGLYAMGDVRWADTLRVVAGARQESADFSVRTFQQGGAGTENRVEGSFETSNVLPALNVTWFLAEDMQARFGYASTESRPTLNELSPATYVDPDSGEIFLGNPEIEPAEIDSVDLRWEWYPTESEELSAGVFTKSYVNPIERVLRQRGDSSVLNSIANADTAEVFGLEFAARAKMPRIGDLLGWTPDWMDNMYVQGNAAFIDSEVTLEDPGIATNTSRPLQGQADQVYNLQIGYDGSRHDWTAALNVVGERLYRPGIQSKPDIFLQPVTTVDLTYGYRPTDSLELKAEVGNLLDPDIEITQGGEIYRLYNEGVSASVSLKWTFY